VFKKPLEDPSQVGGSLLDPTEVKIIFGNLPPIHEIHFELLVQLKNTALNWREDISVGALILKHVSKEFSHTQHIRLLNCIFYFCSRMTWLRPTLLSSTFLSKPKKCWAWATDRSHVSTHSLNWVRVIPNVDGRAYKSFLFVLFNDYHPLVCFWTIYSSRPQKAIRITVNWRKLCPRSKK
jgi:hypothetical protein